MDVGMLWLDDDGRRPLAEKVRRAAEYYESKYGQVPNYCMVNTSMTADSVTVDAIEVAPTRMVLPHHLWLGIKETTPIH